MFILDRNANDTSLSLDLLRAVAAQMVCVGHAWNLVELPKTNTVAPSIGVLLFFILSGFVIAYTLDTKAYRGDYSLGRYIVERTSRIYCAYLPAMLIFCIVEAIVFRLGLTTGKDIGPWRFLANVSMLQNYPGLPWSTFGMSGQTTSVAVEFHIYFFVGSLYFLCIGRYRTLAVIIAIATAKIPLAYFLGLPERGLFIIWLMGFAIYFIARSSKIDRALSIGLCALMIGIIPVLARFANRIDVYDIANYPGLAVCFAALVVVTQNSRVLAGSRWAGAVIHFFAGYSLTLFLLHFLIIRVMYLLWPSAGWSGFVAALFASNLIAAVFAQFTEVHYRTVADNILQLARSVRG